MTGNATAVTTDNAARAEDNRAYVRRLLRARQPQFAAALESAAAELLREREAVCASPESRLRADAGAAHPGRSHRHDR